jgi:hypothetical protein
VTKFRIDTSEGAALVEPAVSVPAEVELRRMSPLDPSPDLLIAGFDIPDGPHGRDVVVFTFEEEPPGRHLPHEAVLRDVAAVDYSDEDALVDLARRIGMFAATRDIVNAATPDRLSSSLGQYARVSRWESVVFHSLDGSFNGEPVALDHLAFTVQLFRALVSHWRAHLFDEDVTEAWADLLDEAERTPDRCWRVFRDVLNAGLRAAPPTIIVEGLTDEGTRTVTPRPPGPAVADALVVQLYNIIVEGLDLKRCPECGASFAKQDGRAKAGQHRRTAVTYCSARCARRNADRALKQRRRASAGR